MAACPHCSPVHVPDLVVQGQEGHGGVDGLAALGTQTNHLEAGLVDLLCQLVHGDVAGGTHQHRPGKTSQQSANNLSKLQLLSTRLQ